MASTYEPIASTTLGSDSATIDFQNIPSAYTDLKIVVQAQASTSSQNLWYRFNNDTGNNYSHTYIYGNGSSAASGRGSSQAYNAGLGFLQPLPTSTQWPIQIINVMNYANTNVFKTCLDEWANVQTSAGEAARFVQLWRSTAAINRFTLLISSGNIKAGSRVEIYGIKAA